jgi:hypothetical protein
VGEILETFPVTGCALLGLMVTDGAAGLISAVALVFPLVAARLLWSRACFKSGSVP